MTASVESSVASDPLVGLEGDPLSGRIVGERYRICRAIGKGGMGVVYEAQHLLIGRRVALKIMTAHASISPAAVERFRREAKAAASVGNSHIVDVLDMGQLDAGSLYIVLEHLNGVDLGSAVASERFFALGRAVRVVTQLCDALSAVHAAGIVHRDLKPDNVFLIVRDGEPDFVKVLDFGICKFQEDDSPQLTGSGNVVGTPQYMSPEQIEGRRDLDYRTDIHALGVLLYFLLTGRVPFSAESLPRLFTKICKDPPPSVRSIQPDLPLAIDAILARALEKRPERRFESCAALKAALLPFARWDVDPTATIGRDLMVSGIRDTELALQAGGSRRHPGVRLGALGIAGAVAVGLAFTGFVRFHSGAQPAPVAPAPTTLTAAKALDIVTPLPEIPPPPVTEEPIPAAHSPQRPIVSLRKVETQPDAERSATAPSGPPEAVATSQSDGAPQLEPGTAPLPESPIGDKAEVVKPAAAPARESSDPLNPGVRDDL